MNIIGFWLDLGHLYKLRIDTSAIGMFKSELLGRLMRGEEVRRRPCPRHQGIMWCGWNSDEQLSSDRNCCDGTGWLKN